LLTHLFSNGLLFRKSVYTAIICDTVRVRIRVWVKVNAIADFQNSVPSE